mmetsp:Transcript_47959/g.66582  ORF Transcript_47959/g.66582 Transcript_47959/m.66582 type:complete len:328 (-) Transcript_47959:436-1419(-)
MHLCCSPRLQHTDVQHRRDGRTAGSMVRRRSHTQDLFTCSPDWNGPQAPASRIRTSCGTAAAGSGGGGKHYQRERHAAGAGLFTRGFKVQLWAGHGVQGGGREHGRPKGFPRNVHQPQRRPTVRKSLGCDGGHSTCHGSGGLFTRWSLRHGLLRHSAAWLWSERLQEAALPEASFQLQQGLPFFRKRDDAAAAQHDEGGYGVGFLGDARGCHRHAPGAGSTREGEKEADGRSELWLRQLRERWSRQSGCWSAGPAKLVQCTLADQCDCQHPADAERFWKMVEHTKKVARATTTWHRPRRKRGGHANEAAFAPGSGGVQRGTSLCRQP